jgi:hypothetical protein
MTETAARLQEQSRAAFEQFAQARGFDVTVYGDGNYADEVMDLHSVWLAAISWTCDLALKAAKPARHDAAAHTAAYPGF